MGGEGMTVEQLARSTSYVSDAERPWVAGQEGAEMRLLAVSSDTGTWIMDARMPPGLRTPTHRHTGRVYAFTRRGRWGYLEYDWMADAGSFVHEQAGVSHTLYVPDDVGELTEVTYVVEGGNVYFDEEGNVLFYEDGLSWLDYYLAACEEQGLGVPPGLVQ